MDKEENAKEQGEGDWMIDFSLRFLKPYKNTFMEQQLHSDLLV